MSGTSNIRYRFKIKHQCQEMPYDLVLLYGPPMQNKTSYVPSSFFNEDFTVISPEEIFKENPALGLRDVTLRVVSTLKEKKQVFIEDEFRLKSARSSILSTLKKKVPSCSVLVLKLIPKYGLKQLCWSHQFSFVQHKKLSKNYDYSQVRQWFDESELTLKSSSDYVDNPDKTEGFDIQEISIPLKAPSNVKFETPCLFLQWEAAVSSSGDLHSVIQDIASKWKSNNPWGRLILIYDGKIHARGYVSESDEIASIKRCALDLSEKGKLVQRHFYRRHNFHSLVSSQYMQICSMWRENTAVEGNKKPRHKHLCFPFLNNDKQIKYPVYVLRVKSISRVSSFCVPPHPGILAFLQLQHFIDLHSKQTVYIYETVDHMNMAQAAGVRHVKGNKLHIHPNLVFAKQAAGPQIPSMLKTMVFSEDDRQCVPFTLPLCDQCDDLVQGSLTQSYENGLSLTVFVPTKETFLSAQESLTESLVRGQRSPSGESSSEETQLQPKQNQNEVTNMSQELPVWMGKRLRRESTIDSISSVENESSSEPIASVRCNKTVYVMTEKELEELAYQVLAQAGKEIRKDKPDSSTSTDPG